MDDMVCDGLLFDISIFYTTWLSVQVLHLACKFRVTSYLEER